MTQTTPTDINEEVRKREAAEWSLADARAALADTEQPNEEAA